MILKQIQAGLEQLYQFRVEQDVESFVIDTQESKRFSPRTALHSRLASEALLIKQSPSQIELGLFVAKDILKTLEKHNPFATLDLRYLKPFLIAIEGVSHFLYFLKKVSEGRPVTQLELELQAEVDKYLLVSFLSFRQTKTISTSLFSFLFDQNDWHPFLNVTERERYREANRFATKFCAFLERRYLRYHRWRNALKEARYFYHLNHWAKIAQLTP